MKQAEYLGAQLTMLIRREYNLVRELEATRDKIDKAYIEIQTMEPDQLYGSTQEIPRVDSAAPWPAEAAEAVTEIRRYDLASFENGSAAQSPDSADIRYLNGQTERIRRVGM